MRCSGICIQGRLLPRLLAMAVVLAASALPAASAAVLDSLVDCCSRFTREGRTPEAVATGRRILALVRSGPLPPEDGITAYAYAAQAYLAADRYDSARIYLDRGVSLWKAMREGDSWEDFVRNRPKSVFTLYNGLGIYSSNADRNYEKATEYFTEGLELAKLYSRRDEYAVMAWNLIFTYFIRNDAGGLRFAEEIYRDGLALGDKRMCYQGAHARAIMLFLAGKYDEAEMAIRQALELDYENANGMWIYSVYANILTLQGRLKEAGRYYALAAESRHRESATIYSYYCLSYGNYLLDTGRENEAVRQFRTGIAVSDSTHNRVFTYKLYHSLSDAYARMGNWREAYGNYRRYHQEADSVFSLKRERTINELAMKYERVSHEAAMRERELELEKKNRFLQLSVFISVLVVLILVVIYIRYRQKDRMYTRTARQYQEAVRTEKALRERLEQTETERNSGNSKGLDQDKSELIFANLEELMNRDLLYRDSTLSRERLAENLGTNRTYLSQVIREKTGKTLTQYLNGYRIRHALQLLSDPATDLPLKAVEYESGFYSSTTFFKIFREEIGMTPAKYREKILGFEKSN